METYNKITELISTTIHKAEPEAKVLLFGSRARGDAKEDSDWDIVVIVNSDKVSDTQFEKINYDLWTIGLDMGQQINTIIYTRRQWDDAHPSLFKYNIINESIEL